MSRPKRYHNTIDRSPYLSLLRHLCGLGWSDERMAQAMTLLSPEQIRGLQSCEWDRESIDDALDDALSEVRVDRLPWTVDQVRYYRRVYLRCKRHRPDVSVLMEGRQLKYRMHQQRGGFLRLLPRQIESDEGRESYWTDGFELPPLAVSVLAILRLRGPIHEREISEQLGLASPWSLRIGRGYILPCLVRLGLAVHTGMRRFALSSTVAM